MEHYKEIAEYAAQLGAILTNNGVTITTAESCTGGGVSYALTDTPGSSAYIERCFVTYSNQAKHELLGVSQQTLTQFGAVSEQTVVEMAKGAQRAAHAEVAIAVSGIAGPTGGSADKPVGTVWFAIANSDKVQAFHQVFTGNRAEIRVQAIEFSLKNTIAMVKS
ncbi:nicotinamide-nucleotide amidohydrolase family protein [Pseudoalteromonas sp. S2755]|uniref:CinA family protein n=1 Tax=Pseudoalteromonas sp. S2755 TaxID=2066523 RepID=UPI00110A6B40|nr:nicotinamide-nucleotide amidohydrolase family protein [Pseudoalteromonas sp. S2755]TMN44237.1 damage-inducible protein CinA [Pseudoalteromonas sp. S2755]